MGRGTKRLRGSESQAQDEPKYDGNKRGYQKWKSLVNQECLGNAIWESLLAGTDVKMDAAAGTLETWAKKWCSREYRHARDVERFCEADSLQGLLHDEKVDFYKYIMSTLAGAARNIVEELKPEGCYKVDSEIQRLYGTATDYEIPLMERGLREACFWNPKGQNFQVEFICKSTEADRAKGNSHARKERMAK